MKNVSFHTKLGTVGVFFTPSERFQRKIYTVDAILAPDSLINKSWLNEPQQWFAKSKDTFKLALHATFKSVTFIHSKDPHTLDEYFR